jgi:hypothetical protein
VQRLLTHDPAAVSQIEQLAAGAPGSRSSCALRARWIPSPLPSHPELKSAATSAVMPGQWRDIAALVGHSASSVAKYAQTCRIGAPVSSLSRSRAGRPAAPGRSPRAERRPGRAHSLHRPSRRVGRRARRRARAYRTSHWGLRGRRPAPELSVQHAVRRHRAAACATMGKSGSVATVHRGTSGYAQEPRRA